MELVISGIVHEFPAASGVHTAGYLKHNLNSKDRFSAKQCFVKEFSAKMSI
jgi:hypothetical protein